MILFELDWNYNNFFSIESLLELSNDAFKFFLYL